VEEDYNVFIAADIGTIGLLLTIASIGVLIYFINRVNHNPGVARDLELVPRRCY